MSLSSETCRVNYGKNIEPKSKVKTNYLPAISFLLCDFQYIEIFGS